MVHQPAHCNLLTSLQVILYLVLTCLCLYFSTYTIAKYMDGETIILSSWEEQDKILFPSITFCRTFAYEEVRFGMM